ncbi:MAG: D-Ala-D-Ala carboxypeptidase family metallohydrolase [Prevotella sp.]
MEHLSAHFTLYEMMRSGTAIDHGILNRPNRKQTENLRNLARRILEPLRQHFGPIVISSGFRSEKVNELVGGVPESQHTKGEAADIIVGNPERAAELMRFVKENLDFDQMILEPIGSSEPRWLHLSYTSSRKNRHETIGQN